MRKSAKFYVNIINSKCAKRSANYSLERWNLVIIKIVKCRKTVSPKKKTRSVASVPNRD